MNSHTLVFASAALETLGVIAAGFMTTVVGAYVVKALLMSAFGGLTEAQKTRVRAVLEGGFQVLGESIFLGFAFCGGLVLAYLVVPMPGARGLSSPKLLVCSAISAALTIAFWSVSKVLQQIWDTKTDIEHRIERGRAVGTLDEARRSLQTADLKAPDESPVHPLLGSGGFGRILLRKLISRKYSPPNQFRSLFK